METVTPQHTFNNLFLGQLDARCEQINTEMGKLYRESKEYGMSDYQTLHVLEQMETMNDFRNMLIDEDIMNCNDPDYADSDPGDCAPNYDHHDENAEEILEKIFHGHELGYLNIPESILCKIQALLKNRN